MKKSMPLLCSLLLISGCGTQQQVNEPNFDVPESSTPLDTDLMNGYTDFLQESFSVLLKDKSGNTSYAPLSLYYPLMLTLEASEGDTASQLQKFLHVQDKDNAKAMETLYRRLYVDNETGELKIANSLWVQKEYPIKEKFTKIATENYYASTHEVDFSQEKTGSLMATWIKDHTNGQLSPSIKTNNMMRLVIINALSYKAGFNAPFDKSDTKEEVFHASDKDVKTPFMHQTLTSQSFIDNEEYSSTSLGLGNSSKLTLVLPKEGKKLATLINQKEFLKNLFQNKPQADFGTVQLALPKFKTHSKLKLVEPLKSLGVTSLFDTAAQLDGISDEHPLYVSNIQQETSIDLNEEGIEASAYTMESVEGLSLNHDTKTLDLNLNREFLYIISSQIDDIEVPLFIGVCANPTKDE